MKPVIRMVRPSHPGVSLKGLLPDMGVSPKGFARKLGESRRFVRELLSGRRAVTPELAERLAAMVGATPGLWLRLRHGVEAWDRRHAPLSPGRAARPAHH